MQMPTQPGENDSLVNVDIVESLSLVLRSHDVDIAGLDHHKLLHSTHQAVEIVKCICMQHALGPSIAEPVGGTSHHGALFTDPSLSIHYA